MAYEIFDHFQDIRYLKSKKNNIFMKDIKKILFFFHKNVNLY